MLGLSLKVLRPGAVLAWLVFLTTLGTVHSAVGFPSPSSRPYGLTTRVIPAAYLRMPPRADGPIPKLLSQTGAFKDARNLVHADGLIP